MRTSSFVQKLALLTLSTVLFCALALAGCKSVVGDRAVETYNENPYTVAIPSNLSPEEVERTIVQVLADRQWVVTERSPKEVVAQLNHRVWRAKAILKVDGNVIRILSDSSLKNATTGKFETAVPKGWLENLQHDLIRRLATTPG